MTTTVTVKPTSGSIINRIHRDYNGNDIISERDANEIKNAGVLFASEYGLPLTWRDVYVQKPNMEAQVFEFTHEGEVRSYPYFVAYLEGEPGALDKFIGLSAGGSGSDLVAFSNLEELKQYARDNVPPSEAPSEGARALAYAYGVLNP